MAGAGWAAVHASLFGGRHANEGETAAWATLESLNPRLYADTRIDMRSQGVQRFTIGRSSASRLALKDPLVSQMHCCLVARRPDDTLAGTEHTKLVVDIHDRCDSAQR
jgi:hypothetical protein